MAQKKKKVKTSVKKNVKSPAKKKARTVAKKVTKSPAKKKVTIAVKKKTKSAVKKKVSRADGNKTKVAARKKTSAPVTKKIKNVPETAPPAEVIKTNEEVASVTAGNETQHNIIEEHKIFEHQFENREDVVMNQENQRVKSAMANRQGTKRVFRTPRHS